jgi:hypothetical protein
MTITVVCRFVGMYCLLLTLLLIFGNCAFLCVFPYLSVDRYLRIFLSNVENIATEHSGKALMKVKKLMLIVWWN